MKRFDIKAILKDPVSGPRLKAAMTRGVIAVGRDNTRVVASKPEK